MAKTIAEFVAEVVKAEDGCGTVYVGEFEVVKSGQIGPCVGVSNCEDTAAYRLDRKPTDATLAEIQAGLEAGGLTVVRDQTEWREQLNEWHAMGGGDGKTW